MTSPTVDIIVPSSPADRKALKTAIRQMSDAMARAEGEASYIKETVSELEKKYNIKGKYIKSMLTDYHKSQFDKKVAEGDAYNDLYEMIMVSTSVDEESDSDSED